jgi:glycosyltransferase involved in cell wall biosynthesis
MVSPVVPALFGNGLAMRAAMSLRALAHHYRVSLLVLPLYSSPTRRNLSPELAALCEAVEGVQRAAHVPSQRVDGPFDVMHIFRLSSLPTARRWFHSTGQIHLDLDDVESVSRLRIASLFREHGRLQEASSEERAARQALESEIEALSTFDRVYVCSAHDEEQLLFCGSAEVRILPNTVDIPPVPLPEPEADEPFTFLLIGNFGYLPNADGLAHVAREVLPRLRESSPAPFRIRVAGWGASPEFDAMARAAGIEMDGFVSDLATWYAGGHAAIVPIRAGGGTRIKALEAFALRRAVVSTSLGAEGIDAEHGIHLLLADDPGEFAAACRQLMEDPELRHRLRENAFQLVSSRYTLDVMVRAVAPNLSYAQPR